MSPRWIFVVFFLGTIANSPALATDEHRFDFRRDTFAFQNDTLWAYSVDAGGRLQMRAQEHPPEYTRRCFVLVRSTLQFRKFVRFDATRPKLDEPHSRRLLRTISRIPLWLPQGGKKIVVPGYADLRSFSKANAKLCQDELGNWWPNYFRTGNWRMAMPFPRWGQENLARALKEDIDRGKVRAVFITRFRPINHCVIVYDHRRTKDSGEVFLAYDPNDAQRPRPLRYDARTRSFFLPRTSYFNGGLVNATSAYVSPWQ